MAGPTTAQRGERQAQGSSAARPPHGPAGRGGAGRRFRLPGRGVLILVLVLAVLGTGGGIWVLYGSSWLRVEQVKASGTQVLTPNEVLDAAAVPVGAPLISVDTDDIEDRLRRKLPRIDSVEVVRSWPHGIGLKVTERKPVLLMKKGANFIEVDDESVRFATVAKAPAGVPLLELVSGDSPSLRRFGADRLLREAVRVTGDLPETVAPDVRTIQVGSYDSITLGLGGDRTVIWGSAEQGEAKARALKALMKAAPGAGHFNVSAPTAPAASGS
ncbi:FtsQ-type POTRA domain-containing protein [Streptomyces sp. ISL-100]|uniref:cell division protein FtsQ/DivIB n=1 Tax=Streptomyces sp. ISL-100 TaxID=2819173 RepID=UPI001BE67E83|nr:FtsQ-type POTRA domain-containing protein [Streptomyces sp. ISL-100]MBT2399922.1 FtsQ-type POTRA domain-containing protein [Streptomyces sp. ISL-100]